jgi:hypothetical protein
MAVLYNSVNVDEKYSPILEPNLFYDNVFQPGSTFTDKYQTGPAGGLYVYKPGISAVAPGTPGRDFTDVNVADNLLQITLNNNFMRSRKIFSVQAAAVSFPKAETELSLAIQECTQGWTLAGIAALVKESTEEASETALTTSNIKADILTNRKTIVDSGARAGVLLCSTKTYALILEYAGSDFTPVMNDSVNATGRVGNWLGFTVYECNGLSASTATYYDYSGTLQTVIFQTDTASGKSVDYVMYDMDAFSILTNFEVTRIIDSERFSGSLAQVEMNSGYRVTNALRSICRKTTNPAG